MERFSVIPFALYLAFIADISAGEDLSESRGIKFFNVIPGNCIVKTAELCEARFRFSWELMRAEGACIFMEAKRDAIYCARVDAHEVVVDLAVSRTQQFTLVLTDAPEHAMSRRVKVLAVGEDVRLKRRHLWSFL